MNYCVMRNSIFILLLLISSNLFGQNTERRFQDFEQINETYQFRVSDGYYSIQFFNENIVETSFIPTDERYNKKSHTVVMQPKDVAIKLILNDDDIQLISKKLKVIVQKSPFQISYFNQDDFIISEKRGYHKDSLEKIQFNLKPKEILYGGGARALGMNRRGHKLELYNRAHYGYENYSELMNYTMPIVISSDRYMLHFDNAPIGFLDLDSQKNNTLEYQTISGRKTYQVIVGNTWDDMVDNFTQLTGRQPMLPRWSLGNFSSRFGYRSQEEVIKTIQAFREEEIPVDAVILDLYWFGKEVQGTMGNLKFDKDSFPEPKKMIADLRQKNVETILITEPFVLTTSDRWNEALQKEVLAKDSLGNPYTYDFFFGNTGLIDIYSSQGYNWFLEIYKDLIGMGITGMWGDLGEPEVHPTGLLHSSGTADEVHNIYGHDWARLVQQAYKDTKMLERPFILMRAGYSGSQQFGIVPWSGDVNRTWGGLQSQPEISLQMGMQGIGYMHSDLGGFAGDNLDDDLYVRWLQYGVFQPIFRPHAQEEVPSEPVFRSEKVKDLSRQAIDLRYQMLPYNYHLMFENTQTGKPLMRPLFFEEGDKLDLFNYSDAYFWGNDFLVAPILHPNQKTQKVYFPNSSNWVDFYTNESYEGGETYDIKTNKAYIPTFVRSGAIIPFAPKMQSTKEYLGNNLILNYYFDPNISKSSARMYNDDGILAEAFEREKFELLQFQAHVENDEVLLELNATTAKNFATSSKKITWVIHNLSLEPTTIIIGGKSYDVPWKRKSKTLKIETIWNTEEDKVIKIQLKE